MVLRPSSVALGALALALSLGTSALAQSDLPTRPPAQPTRDGPLLRSIFDDPKLDPSRFAPSFTDAVPLPNVQEAIDAYRGSLGALQSVTPAGPDEEMTFARGTLRASIAYDENGKVRGLLFHDEISAQNRAALERLLRASKSDPAWFSAKFISEAGPAQIDSLLERLRAASGTFQRVEVRNGSYVSVFSKAANPTQISTDADGKIASLAFRPSANATPAP